MRHRADLGSFYPYITHESSSEDKAECCQCDVDWCWIVVEKLMVGSVDQRLGKVDQAAEADDGTVDTAKSGKAKDFRRIITSQVSKTLQLNYGGRATHLIAE